MGMKGMVAVGLAAGLAAAPAWADATDDRIGQLEAQMRALQQQIEQLKKEREGDRKELAEVKESAQEVLPGVRLPQNTGVMLTGYVDLEYSDPQNGSKTFDNHHFNPIFLGMLGDKVLVEAEVEYEHSGTEVALEYATVDYLLNDYVTLVGGKFLMPFGEFNDRLHPSWINKFPSRPIVFDEVVPGTWSEVGAQARGAVGLNPLLGTDRPVDLEYILYLVNGLQGAAGASLRNLTGNDRDDNDNIAAGGRLGLRVLPWGSLGTSWYHGAYTTDGNQNITMLGLDWAAHPTETLEIRGEYAFTRQEVATQEDLRKRGWYLQAAYSLNDLANWLSDIPGSHLLGNAELVARASRARLETTTGTNNQHEVALGLNYTIKPSLVWRVGYEWSQENGGTAKTDDDLFITQVAYGF